MNMFARNAKPNAIAGGVVEKLPVGVAHLVDGTLRYINDTFAALHGLEVQEMRNTHWTAYLQPMYRSEIENAIGWSAASQEPWYGVVELLHANAPSTIVCSIRALSPHEAVIGLTHASAAMQSAGWAPSGLTYVRDAILASTQGYWQWDMQTDMLQVYGPFLRDMGYDTEGQAVTMDWLFASMHPEDMRMAEAAYEQYVQQVVQEWRTDVRLRTNDNKDVWTSIHGRFVRWNQQEQPLIMAGTITNVHSSHVERATVANTMAALQGIATANGVFQQNGNHDTSVRMLLECMMNRVSAEHGAVLAIRLHNDGTGSYSVVAEIQRSAADHKPPAKADHNPPARSAWRPLPAAILALLEADGRSVQQADSTTMGSDTPPFSWWSGSMLSMHNLADALQTRTARIGGLVVFGVGQDDDTATAHDAVLGACASTCFMHLSRQESSAGSAVLARVQDGKHATTLPQYALGRVARQQEALMANVSHELRQPISTIVTATEALLEGVYGEVPPAQLLRLHDVHDSGLHMLSLLNDVLDASKARQGRLIDRRATCSLQTILSAAVRMMQVMADQKHITITVVDRVAHDVLLQADERRLQQVFINLLSNAIKFTPSWGEIHVELDATANEQSACVRVTDTGVGILPEEVPHLFEPYWQRSTDTRRDGTGLGLPIAQYIVDQHGGMIDVQSVSGTGSSFSVHLPWKLETTDETNVPLKVRADGNAQWSVMIVDANTMYAQHVANVLATQGAAVTIASSKHDGLRRLSQQDYDVVLMAIDLQGTDDLEMLQSMDVVATARGNHTALVATSVMIMPGDVELCTSVGASALITKSASPQVIRQYVARPVAQTR